MSQFIKQSVLAAAAALTLAASGANATTFNFYQAKTASNLLDSTSASVSVTSGGLGLTLAPVSSSSSAKVAQRYDGIGVSTGLLSSGDLDNGDTLLLTFSQAVTFSSLGLSSWDKGLFGVGADKVSITTGGQTYNLTAGAESNGVTTFSLASLNLTGVSFLIKAEGTSSFRLANLNVSAVPEAGTSAMLGLGLVGIAAVARRQSRKAA